MQALPLPERAALRPFAERFPFEAVLWERIIGEGFGEAFVDRWPDPQVVLLSGAGTACLAGDARAEGAEGFARVVFDQGQSVLLDDEASWGPLLRQVHGEAAVHTMNWTILQGSSFDLEEIRAIKAQLPEPYTARRMTVEDARGLIEAQAIALGAWWASPEELIAEGFGFVICEGETIVGSIHTARRYRHWIRVFIQTQQVARRKGLAMAAVACFIEHCRTHGGFRSWWNAVNPDAIALAGELGFSPVGRVTTWHKRMVGRGR